MDWLYWPIAGDHDDDDDDYDDNDDDDNDDDANDESNIPRMTVFDTGRGSGELHQTGFRFPIKNMWEKDLFVEIILPA